MDAVSEIIYGKAIVKIYNRLWFLRPMDYNGAITQFGDAVRLYPLGEKFTPDTLIKIPRYVVEREANDFNKIASNIADYVFSMGNTKTMRVTPDTLGFLGNFTQEGFVFGYKKYK